MKQFMYFLILTMISSFCTGASPAGKVITDNTSYPKAGGDNGLLMDMPLVDVMSTTEWRNTNRNYYRVVVWQACSGILTSAP
ncbi:hypothetical protein NLN86_22455 [Citrobacter portucalensis]|uniref:Uncharacterized protein n=1 Tax=Citrobacter portucalensis TaxID=1639133 RepID=A0AAW5WCR8_9ENTR|nr:hypothetical protein [Citrobacter portucalensis]MCX9004393.1 hypothetical protein [Citrobacter portucalensis]MCX9059199.1 hypothetical protein [Citrobacter portucalensis]